MISLKTKNTHPIPSNERVNQSYLGVFNWRVSSTQTIWSPPMDVYETELAYFVQVEIAGMSESDFSISVDQNILSISGIRQDRLERISFHQMEIHFGEFLLQVEVPGAVNISQTQADYRDGFLRITLPKLISSTINTHSNAE